MKEQEPKPIKCSILSKDCTPDVLAYGFVETPNKFALNMCGFHIKIYGEALRPFVDHMEIQKRLLNQEGL